MAYRFAENENGEQMRFRSAEDGDGNTQWFPYPEEAEAPQPTTPLVSAADMNEGPAVAPQIVGGRGSGGAVNQGPRSAEGMDYVTGLASSAAHGASANWIDEALAIPMAGAAHALGDAPEGESVFDTYGKMKGAIRDRQKRFDESNPYASTTAKIVSGMIPISKAAAGAGLVKTGLTGAAYGAAEYAGQLDDFKDTDLAEAAIQTGLSAAMPMTMQKTGEGVRKWLANRGQTEVDAVLKQLVKDSGLTPDQIKARAKDYGPEASLADVTDAPGIHYAQGVAGVGDAKTQRIIEHNQNKIYAAKDRIRDTMSDISGKKEGQYYESFDKLLDNRKVNAEANYGKALDEGVVAPTDKMLRIIEQNPMVSESWKRVQDVYERRKLPLPKLFDFDDAGKAVWTGERFPNMRAMQELKWEMDSTLKGLKGSLDSKGKQEYRRSLQDYKEFMTDVNRQNPDFRKANAQYAGDSAMLDAQEMGKKHGLGGQDVETQIKYIDGLKKSEKDAYLQGVLTKEYGKMGGGPEEQMTNANKLASENSNKVLSSLIGKDKAKKLMKRIGTEKRYREVDTKVRQNSQTAQRQQAAEVMNDKMKSTPVSEAFNPMDKGNIIKGTVDAIAKFKPKMSMGQVNELADILTKPGGVEKTLTRLEMVGLGRKEAEELVKAISKTDIAKAAAGSAPAGLMDANED